MDTHKICFNREIRKLSIYFGKILIRSASVFGKVLIRSASMSTDKMFSHHENMPV